MAMTPLKAAKEKCLDCCCYQRKEVQLCQETGCALWAYRTGRRPDRDTLRAAQLAFKEEKKHRIHERSDQPLYIIDMEDIPPEER